MEYISELSTIGKFVEDMNSFAKDGWRVHTVLDWGEGTLRIIYERQVNR